jgi:hypothetical protein
MVQTAQLDRKDLKEYKDLQETTVLMEHKDRKEYQVMMELMVQMAQLDHKGQPDPKDPQAIQPQMIKPFPQTAVLGT